MARNWSFYNNHLKNRGNIGLWLDKAVLKAWKSKKKDRKGQVGRPWIFSLPFILILN